MNRPSQKVFDQRGRRVPHPKPRQATIISRCTARTLKYLEERGLADFSESNLVVYFGRGPRNHKEARLMGHAHFPHRVAV